ncbi:hypothetical protein L210DRAFT_3505938 [Boletus edulis BED1]|uniref:Uncharacterized protein n=1 Tax=Boletus edulis BED1 TaxID=1328754 RepID=A0AAD4BPJ8_BOLED|nr:hypothetical protein L210DRAFT_3505938 [Boletus edulis BED1]
MALITLSQVWWSKAFGDYAADSWTVAAVKEACVTTVSLSAWYFTRPSRMLSFHWLQGTNAKPGSSKGSETVEDTLSDLWEVVQVTRVQETQDQARALPKCKDPAVGPADAGATPGPSTSQPGLEHAAGEIGHLFDGNEGLLGEYRDIPHSLAPDQDTPDFKTEYHPRSKHPTFFQMSNEFHVRKEVRLPPNPIPWHLFQCQGDFEFAKITLQASLNKGQVNALLNLISHVAKKEAQVTLQNEAELRKACDSTVGGLTPFVPHTVTVLYKKEQCSYEVHVRDLWQWALNLLTNLHLAPHFTWDAEHLYKCDGEQFERFIDEPWTADRWWDIQSNLPSSADNAVLLAFILYTDKSKLSSFGTVKGYPVITRCANLVTVAIYHLPFSTLFLHFTNRYYQIAPITWTLLLKATCYYECSKCTLLMIESELLVFNDILKEYIELVKKTNVPDLRLEWNFPKIHLWKHAVRDIWLKGVLRNFSTWPNESMHGTLREAYDYHSNGRDVATQVEFSLQGFASTELQIQILCVDQHTLALKLLRQSIDSQNCLDDNEDPKSNLAMLNLEANGNSTNVPNSGPEMPHCQYSLGSPCKPIDMRTLETCNTTDRAFSELCQKFTAFLNSSIHGWGYKDVSYIKIPSTFEVHYGSTVNWRETMDYLRCNPLFYGKARYDCALVQFTTTTVAFVHFILIFSCHIPELKGSFEFALMQPFMKKIGVSCQLDRDLNLIHVKAAPWSSPIFIPLASIVRGAVLAPDPENADKFVALSYLDDDMFLCLKDMTVSCI